jgi:GNAT superfamily N-acetyltransferase
MIIRKATKEDIPQLCTLLDYLFSLEEEFTPNTELQVKGLNAILDDSDIGQIYAAVEDDKIVGMVSLLYTISTALGSRVAVLEDMIVDPSYRKQGIGTKLIKYAQEDAKSNSCMRVTLLTDSENLKAQKFYRDCGFDLSPMLPFRKLL